jgi:hypothetical protein
MGHDRAFRTWQERLRADLQRWKASDGDEGALLRGAPLAEAESWVERRGDDVSDAEQGFIAASVAARNRDREEQDRQRQIELELAEYQRREAEQKQHEEMQRRIQAEMETETLSERNSRLKVITSITPILTATAALAATSELVQVFETILDFIRKILGQ